MTAVGGDIQALLLRASIPGGRGGDRLNKSREKVMKPLEISEAEKRGEQAGEEAASGWWHFTAARGLGKASQWSSEHGGGGERMSSADVLGEKHPGHREDRCGTNTGTCAGCSGRAGRPRSRGGCWYRHLFGAARAAPETRRLISNRNFFLIVPVAGKAKTKGPAVSVSGEGRFLAVLWLCHAAEGGREHSGPCYQGTALIPFMPQSPPKDPMFKYCHTGD